MRGRTVVRVRRLPGGTDPYGDPVEGTEDRLEISRCAVAPRRTSTEGERQYAGRFTRDGLVIGLDLFAPYDADITHDDQIEIDGVLYDVEGEPGRWESPYTGRRPGLVVELRRAEG